MNPDSAPSGPPSGSTDGFQRQGSVRRAREMLEAGRRREDLPRRAPPFAPNPAHMTQWPLPDGQDLVPGGYLAPARPPVPPMPRGPPPQRPRRPSETPPSPSVYSERSFPDPSPYPSSARPPAPSFSHAIPYHHPPRPVPREPIPPPLHPHAFPPRKDSSAEPLHRHPSGSSVGTIPEFPLPEEPNQAYTQPRRRPPPGLVPAGRPRKSSVSPIPEEVHYPYKGSFASSKAIPSSWGSGPVESDILDAYMDGRSDDGNGETSEPQNDNDGTLVRQASIGKRGKPELRTIQKPNGDSNSASDEQVPTMRTALTVTPDPEVSSNETNGGHAGKVTRFRDSSSSVSSASQHGGVQSAPIFLDVQDQHPAFRSKPEDVSMPPTLPSQPNPMAEPKPRVAEKPRPPRLDLSAVRDAEARGSLTSLPDLIRRATQLATRLDHGRTASRNDILDEPKPPRLPFAQRLRNSGSLSDILASFPPPRSGTPDGRSSWPVLFKKRSALHNILSHDSRSLDEGRKQRRCCGLRPSVFIAVIVAIIILIAIVILLPVFLVAVPKEDKAAAAAASTTCEKTNPCHNGGVSVSSGDICSCVCTNSFTGSQCTNPGDASCVTTDVGGRNMTMGDELPRLFKISEDQFGIPLDAVTIMALFSQSDVSCMTENALVLFKALGGGSGAGSRASRRMRPAAIPTPSLSPTATARLNRRNDVATMNGILYDGSVPTTTISPSASTSATKTKEYYPQTHSSTPTSTSTSTSTPTPSIPSVPKKITDFSRLATLYIFQKTAVIDAAMAAEDDIQSFLSLHRTALSSNSSSSSSPKSGSGDGSGYKGSDGKIDPLTVNLSGFGIMGNFTVDFQALTIGVPNGSIVGGS